MPETMPMALSEMGRSVDSALAARLLTVRWSGVRAMARRTSAPLERSTLVPTGCRSAW